MTTMNISLPDTMRDFVDAQVREHGYSTSSEYVRDLIRTDRVRQGEQRLAVLMREGLESGPAIPVDAAYWADKRAKFTQKHSRQ